MGMQMQGVVVAWQIYKLTQDPLALGLTGLAEVIPALSVALFAGHMADRHRRKPIILAGLGALTGGSVLLFLLSSFAKKSPLLLVSLYGVIFLTGLIRGILAPAFVAFMAQILPEHRYANGAAWNSAGWQLASVSGPALGGFIYALSSDAIAYSVEAIFISCSAFLYIFIKELSIPESHKHEEPIWKSLQEGLRFVFSNQVILGAISLDLFAVLFGGAVALLPIFAKEVLHTGPDGLGMLRSAPAVGAVFMALFLAHRPPMGRTGWILLYSVAGYGACMVLFALSSNLYFSLFLLALSGALDNVSVVIRFTVVQSLTPDSMRGRVAAVNTMFIGSSNEIGAFESGVTAKWMGLVPSVIFGGMMTLVTVSFTAMKAKRLRELSLARIRS